MKGVNVRVEKTSNDYSFDDKFNLVLENFRLLNDHNQDLLLCGLKKLLTMTQKEIDKVNEDLEAYYNQVEAEMNETQP